MTAFFPNKGNWAYWISVGIAALLFGAPSITFGELRQSITLGPTFHMNFGSGKPDKSWGFEISYWIEPHSYALSGEAGLLPSPWSYGADLGIELTGSSIRIYSELEIGPIFYGLGIGPVLEMDRVSWRKNMGGQITLWGAAVGGLDLRYRLTHGGSSIAGGIFGKVPIPLYQPDYM